jgi:hypothetical protein
MEWLNYHHLYYFWVVARTGSVAAASRELRLTHPTVSAQIHQVEGIMGEPLFKRAGIAAPSSNPRTSEISPDGRCLQKTIVIEHWLDKVRPRLGQ